MSSTDLAVEESVESTFVQRSPRQIAWMRLRRNRTGMYSAYVVIFFIAAAFLSPIIIKLWGLSSTDLYLDGLNDQAMPIGFGGGISWKHPFGLEPGAGRDVFSMLFTGS